MKFGKKVLALCLSLTMVLSLAAFGMVAYAEDGGEVELNFWTWRPEDMEFFDAVIAEFEAANPGIKIVQNAIKSTDYNTTLAAALAGDSGPDVFMSRAYGGLQTFADSGYMVALDELMPELKDFDAAKLAGATSSDGKVYGVPALSQTIFCYYNTEIYEELGLTVPQTWDQFIANLKACTDAGYTGLANGTKEGWICELMLGGVSATWYGGNDFFDKVVAGEINFEDPIFVNAVDKLNELKPFMPMQFEGVPYTDMQTSFSMGMSAHFIGGSFEAATFLNMNPDIKYDIFAVPGETESTPKYVSVYADMNYSINAASAHQAESLKLLKYLATPEFGKKVVDELQMITSVPNVDVAANPFIAKVLDLQAQGNTPYIFLVGFRYEQPTGSSLFQAAAQAMFTGDYTAEQVCKEVQDGIAVYYAPFQ